jgi:hypothetical protein
MASFSDAGVAFANVVAGTSTVPSIQLTNGDLATTASDGTLEYKNPLFYLTPQAEERGVLRTDQTYRLNYERYGSASTSMQNIFNVGVTLSSSTVYYFRFDFFLSSINNPGGSLSITVSFTGTATVNNIGYTFYGAFAGSNISLNATNNISSGFSTTAGNQLLSALTVAGTVNSYMTITGTVSVNAGGTFIPQYSTQNSGITYKTNSGSTFMICPIGVSGGDTSVGTWSSQG